ncbi:hypothetical protein A2U01_0065160, partial [Trifolium medium]|nr:hypothetical protein [Trifolium medium]
TAPSEGGKKDTGKETVKAGDSSLHDKKKKKDRKERYRQKKEKKKKKEGNSKSRSKSGEEDSSTKDLPRQNTPPPVKTPQANPAAAA